MTLWLLTYTYAVAKFTRMEHLQSWLRAERGRQVALAEALGIRPPVVAGWLSGRRPIPVSHMAAIERFTDGAVTRRDLRPDDAHLIWPELAESEPNTPPAPADQARAAINNEVTEEGANA